MKAPHPPDLFPESLLVERGGDGRVYTDSRKIAEHFGKRHDNVVRAIRALVKRTQDPRRLLNFEESSYLNEQNKPQPMYRLTRKGFEFVVSGFTGQAAEEWKWHFLDAFEQMEAALQAREARYARALDRLRPALRPVVEGTEAGLPRAAIAEPLGKSARAVTHHRQSARRLGLLGTPARAPA